MSVTPMSSRLALEQTLQFGPRRTNAALSQHWTSPYAARRIHLVGVGGCGMSGLAGVLLRCGAIVSGSDLSAFRAQARLQELGATITTGHAPLNVPSDCDLVVYSAAVKEDNPELLEAKRRGIRRLKYAEMLGQVMRLRTGIAIAGTHGKSTTTALTAYILREAKADPTFVVGANVKQLDGSSSVGDGSHFVVEACEYDRSFLNLLPKFAAIMNVEEDHLDCFENLAAITDAFRAFASLVPPEGMVLANADDPQTPKLTRDVRGKVETFGTAENATWRAVGIASVRGCYRFEVQYKGRDFLHASLDKLPGRHQVYNALAATALCHHAGLTPEQIASALSTFAGADRRLMRRGEPQGILLLDDYGHHPTEVRVTLDAVREHYPGRRLWVIFQPHQHSRTRFLLEDFAKSFGAADHLLVPDIYFVRDSAADQGAVSSAHLVERVRAHGGDALYLPSHQQIVEHVVAHAKSGEIVLTMGAGDVWRIADELARRLTP